MGTQRTIIHTEAAAGWGGQEMRTFTECKWFREQGWRVILLAKEGSPIATKFAEDDFEVIHVPFTKKTQIKDLVTCLRIFEKEMPEVVATHSNIDTRVALIAATKAGVKHRIRYRHVSIPVRANLWNKIIYRRLATHIVTTGDCISNPLIRDLKLPSEKVTTIHTGIQVPDGLPDRESARQALCKELDLPTSTRFLGQVSVLRRWKGQADVMEAFDRIADKFPDYHLVFVGGGHGEEYLPPIAKSKKHSDRIHFTGHQTNPWPYFLAFDVNFLASTEGEGIPQVGMQSMLCQTAFVGTKVGGIPEIVQHEQTGLLVDAESPEQLADSMTALLKDDSLREQVVDNAYEWATNNTTVAHMGNRVLDIINA